MTGKNEDPKSPSPVAHDSHERVDFKLTDAQELLQKLPLKTKWIDDLENIPLDIRDPFDPSYHKDKLFIVDRLIPPQAILSFSIFSFDGTLPNGENTTLPIFTKEEVMYTIIPYKEWALPPHDALELPVNELLLTSIGSNEDPGRLTIVDKSVHAMKTRLWEGMVPLSQNQWREKELHKAENFEYACQYIEAVIIAFDYLNVPKHTSYMCGTFNSIYDHLEEFDNALDRLRRSKSEQGPRQEAKMAALWEEFIRVRYEVMTRRAHDWVISHLEDLRQPLLQHICTQGPVLKDTISPDQLAIVHKLRRLAGLAAEADYTIFMPMDGYRGHTTPPPEEVPETQSPDLATRRWAYLDKLKFDTLTTGMTKNMRENLVRSPGEEPAPKTEKSAQAHLYQTIDTQLEAQKRTRQRVQWYPEPELLSPVAWIGDILRGIRDSASTDQPVRKVGFVIYRLCYDGDTAHDNVWSMLLNDIKQDLADWGSGIDGAEDLKPFLELHPFDGKKLGLAEDDIDGAKKHFAKFLASPDFPRGMDENSFLVLDSASFSSYNFANNITTTTTTTTTTMTTTTPSPAQFDTRFLLTVDASFDPAEGLERPEESPGYIGEMRIQTSLIWPELFALLTAQAQWMEELWPLAMRHPQKIYVGYVVPEMLKRWRSSTVNMDGVAGGLGGKGKGKGKGKGMPGLVENMLEGLGHVTSFLSGDSSKGKEL
ncbi:hypothetical protein PABG_05715 [Paracoccidioides brasiliensis Pb03]|nr:hypothetical protein PABG_05715 [Paracoccidioides brasiliensis Pb03]